MKYIEEESLEAQEHFENLLMFVQNNTDKDAHYMETEIFQRLLKLGNSLMQMYISSVGTGKVGKYIELDDGRKFKSSGEKNITHTTIFGEVPVSREYYRNLNSKGIFPLDQNLNLPERTYSYLLQRFCMGVALNDSYEEARKYINDLFGINIAQSSLQQISKESSAYFEEYYKAKEVNPTENDDLIIVSADGKGIPIKGESKSESKKRLGRGEKNGKKKMALVGTVYNVEPQYDVKEREFNPKDKKVWAFLEDKERTMDLLKDDVNSRLSGHDFNNKIIFLADGERRLWNLKDIYFPEATEILDWYHTTEYLWKAVYVFYPEGSEEAVNWVEEMEAKIMNGKITDVLTGLKVRITKNNIKGKNYKTLKSVIDYFDNNKHRMKYNEYVEQGYPIGSGNVESACRYLIKDRMEKTGMRWKFPGAQAILSIRSVYLNGDYSDYWNYYMERENKRLYNDVKKCA